MINVLLLVIVVESPPATHGDCRLGWLSIGEFKQVECVKGLDRISTAEQLS